MNSILRCSSNTAPKSTKLIGEKWKVTICHHVVQNVATTSYCDITKAVLGCRSCGTLLEVRRELGCSRKYLEFTLGSLCLCWLWLRYNGQVEQLVLREWCGVEAWRSERKVVSHWSQTPAGRPEESWIRSWNLWWFLCTGKFNGKSKINKNFFFFFFYDIFQFCPEIYRFK